MGAFPYSDQHADHAVINPVRDIPGQLGRHILSQALCLVFFGNNEAVNTLFKDLRNSPLHEIAQLSDLQTRLHPHSSSSPA